MLTPNFIPIDSAVLKFLRLWQTDTQADRQTHRQTDRQTHRQTDKQTDRQTELSFYRYRSVWVSVCVYIYINRKFTFSFNSTHKSTRRPLKFSLDSPVIFTDANVSMLQYSYWYGSICVARAVYKILHYNWSYNLDYNYICRSYVRVSS